nr:hypothetical protein [Edwardsiella anguillarum]WHQ16072.1 hypothetical protein MQ083_06605 [Edwardsiella anguillarum]
MSTITKEWLQQTIAEFENTHDVIPFGLDDDFEAEQATMLQAEPVSPDAEESDDTVFTCPRCGRRSSRPNGEHYCHPLAAAARETAPKQETSND